MNYHIKTIAITICFSAISCNNNQNSSKHGTNENNQKITVHKPTKSTFGEIKGVYGGCGYNYTPAETEIQIFEPREREVDQINSILKFTGLSSNFEVFSANIDNAVATIIENKRYILYDPDLLSYTDQKSGNYWTSMSILAHEIGHHLSGHTISNNGSNPKDELDADKYSGFILYKLGASIEQATAAIKALGSEVSTKTHPEKNQRIKAITEGWNEANQTRYNGAIPPPPEDNPNDYCTYDYRMLISEENLYNEYALIHESQYGSYDYFYGVITEVVSQEDQVKRIKVYVHRTGKEWKEISNLDSKIIDISLDDYWKSPDVNRFCARNIQYLLIPGRRLKFAFVEGLTGGTIEIGWFRLTYAEGLNGSAF